LTSRSKGPFHSDQAVSGNEPAPDARQSGAGAFDANGWTIYFHPLFTEQCERLVTNVELARRRHGANPKSADVKLLALIRRLVTHDIPGDPMRSAYRQGKTLGAERKHWFRAKFGGSRFRLFFRFRSDAKIIVITWVNDAETLRTYGSRTDAYEVFKGMLDSGNPSDDWDALLKAASDPEAASRARKLFGSDQ
jgi:toxin YhaV